jgi:hypothetical protein
MDARKGETSVASEKPMRVTAGSKERGREERAKRFEEAARTLGHAYEQQGLTEEQVLESLEATQRQLYEERYGNSKT